MGFFDDNDPFDEIIRNFLGNAQGIKRRHKENFIKGEDEDRIIDFIEDDERVYLVFELPGYDEKDISIMIKGKDLKITAKKLDAENIQDYLHQKLKQGVSIEKKLPDFVNLKKFSKTMKNGVLEIVFDKSKGDRDD